MWGVYEVSIFVWVNWVETSAKYSNTSVGTNNVSFWDHYFSCFFIIYNFFIQDQNVQQSAEHFEGCSTLHNLSWYLVEVETKVLPKSSTPNLTCDEYPVWHAQNYKRKPTSNNKNEKNTIRLKKIKTKIDQVNFKVLCFKVDYVKDGRCFPQTYLSTFCNIRK